MMYNTIYSLSLLLLLHIEGNHVDAFVNALVSQKMPLFSTVKDKLTSTTPTTEAESSLSNEIETSNASVVSVSVDEDSDINSRVDDADTIEKDANDGSEKDDVMKQLKESGVAGIISYASWELAFWTVSVPVCVLGSVRIRIRHFCSLIKKRISIS